ncbi:MAG: hypothetical protein PHU23_19665, partial [Dehalococcoidales bacterium]|nr:hypothetical protein [Dehalococcoidales bacterium]
LYGLKSIYDADWIIHAGYNDPRELWFHRNIMRILKVFSMGYARFEMRSAYHFNFSSRSSNVIPRAIFDSPFVQKRWAFVSVMEASPAGVTNITADRDMYAANRTVTRNILLWYGKMIRLLSEIDGCVLVLDGMSWVYYIHGGGLVSGNMLKAPLDYFNLDISGKKPETPSMSPIVKAMVVNYVFPLMLTVPLRFYPTFISGPEVAAGLTRAIKRFAVVAEDLKSAIKMACEKAGTDKVIIFDGSYNSLNVSRSMAEFLIAKAPMVAEKVDGELLPLWLKQRGLDL